jgi:hypothetical protein
MPTPPKVRSRVQRATGRGTVTTSRQINREEEVSDTRDFEDEVNCPNPAYVSVSQGMTKNMGDYNSVKINVHVSLPCLPYDDDIRRAHVRASKLVNEFLDEEYEAAVGE